MDWPQILPCQQNIGGRARKNDEGQIYNLTQPIGIIHHRDDLLFYAARARCILVYLIEILTLLFRFPFNPARSFVPRAFYPKARWRHRHIHQPLKSGECVFYRLALLIWIGNIEPSIAPLSNAVRSRTSR